jgi:hypothetical protein
MEIPIHVAATYGDEQQRQKLEAALRQLVTELATQLRLDLSRLEGITIATNFDRALAEFDNGGLETGRKLARSTGDAVGVGVTPVCIRAASARCHVFLPASQVSPLLVQQDSKREERSVVRYTVAHELGHAHDLAQRARHLEPYIMKTPGDVLTPAVFWQLAEICWNEYAACRFSAPVYPQVLDLFAELLIRALQEFRPAVRNTLLKCKAQSTSAPAFAGAVEALYPVLKYSSYVLGHLDGLEISSTPRELAPPLEQAGVLELFQELSNILRGMWNLYPTWTSIDVYGRLIEFLKRAFRFAAVDVYVADGQLKSRLVLEMLPSFGITR